LQTASKARAVPPGASLHIAALAIGIPIFAPVRNSVLLGSQKDKFPGINLALILDHFEDLFSFEILSKRFPGR
jgi:hypothetical protein